MQNPQIIHHEQQLLTYRQVVEITNISRMTIWRMLQAGKFPLPVNLGPRCQRFRSVDIKNFCAGVWGAEAQK